MCGRVCACGRRWFRCSRQVDSRYVGVRILTIALSHTAAMIPVIVILSGIIAGLTLGCVLFPLFIASSALTSCTASDLSLDTTQLAVLAKTGTDKQKRAAARVIPLLQNRHLLLVTLLLANMLLCATLFCQLHSGTDGICFAQTRSFAGRRFRCLWWRNPSSRPQYRPRRHLQVRRTLPRLTAHTDPVPQ